MRQRIVTYVILALAIGALSITVLAQTTGLTQTAGLLGGIKTLVVSGQPSPGGHGAVFTALGHPSINSTGTVAFKANLTSSVATFGQFVGKLTPSGIYVDANGSISRVVGYGDEVPNRPAKFAAFGDPVINDSGQIAFVGRIGNGISTEGVYLQAKSGLIPIAVTGDPAPNTHGGSFATIGRYGLAINNAGTVAFEATYTGATTGDGIFVYSNSTITGVVLRGQHVPIVQNETFSHILGVGINQSGQLAFAATLSGGSVSTGVFSLDGVGITPVAVHGQQLPGGLTLDNFRQPAINAAGDVAFVHTTASPGRGNAGVFSPHDLFISASGSLSQLAGVNYNPRPNSPILTGNIEFPSLVRMADGTDSVLFAAWNQTKGRNAIFLYSHSALIQLVQEGDSTPAGGSYSFIGDPVITPTGTIAFVSRLQGISAQVGIFTAQVKF